MTYRLVCSGYATPGQTSRSLLESFSIGMLLDIAYGMIVEPLTAEQRVELDERLAELDAEVVEDEVVRKELDDGRVVEISQARLDRIRRNMAGVKRIDPRKG